MFWRGKPRATGVRGVPLPSAAVRRVCAPRTLATSVALTRRKLQYCYVRRFLADRSSMKGFFLIPPYVINPAPVRRLTHFYDLWT